jgi:hypothetical protein
MKPSYLFWILIAGIVAACQPIQPEGSMAQPGAATALSGVSAETALQSQLYNERASMSPGISSSSMDRLNLIWIAPTD